MSREDELHLRGLGGPGVCGREKRGAACECIGGRAQGAVRVWIVVLGASASASSKVSLAALTLRRDKVNVGAARR